MQELRSPSECSDLPFWQQHLLDKILYACLILGFFTYIPSVWLCLKEHLYLIATIDTLIYGALIWMHYDKRLAHIYGAATVCVSCLVIGLLLLFTLGPFGGGPVWLFAFPIMTGVLINSRAALAALALNILVLVVIFILIYCGFIHGTSVSENELFRWVVISSNFLLLNALVTLSMTMILSGLQRTVEQERTLRDQLQQQVDATRKAEQDLRKHRDNLEKLVHERTEELHKRVAEVTQLNKEMTNLVNNLKASKAHLERSGKALKASNEELKAFSYSVSHDLRAPLRHLTGYSELLKKNNQVNFDERTRRHLTFISEAAARMDQLIDALLDFSRVGRVELHKKPVNLDALVKEVVNDLTSDTKGRHILWDIATPLPLIRADANLLRAVLTNLFSNALKFTQTRDETIIQMGYSLNESETIFFIRDNGVGFDMKYVDKLFGVFQRLHSMEQFEGTGIGLANVRRIIQRHGGRVWAESVLNEGAAFYFSLPGKAIKTT